MRSGEKALDGHCSIKILDSDSAGSLVTVMLAKTAEKIRRRRQETWFLS
jgi:hypothetical protein